MITDSANRVPEQTDASANQKIEDQIHHNIAQYECGDPALIQQRIEQLDAEWDIERVLQTNAAGLSLFGIFMAALRGKAWLMLSATVGIFLLEHGIQGWCPPASFLRQMGFRTRKEIDQERYGLKVLRGDFQNLPIKPEKQRFNMNILYTALKR